MPQRVLILANDYTTIINFRMELVKGLIEEGYEVGVALPDHERVREIEALGCHYLPLKLNRKSKNPINDLLLLRDISNVIRSFTPNFVLTFTIKPNIYGGVVCAKIGIPYFATITGLGSSIENGGLLRNLSFKLYSWGLKNARKVFFQNEGNFLTFRRNKVYKGDFEILPGSGVNLEKFDLIDYPPDNEINFVFVGRVMKEKGINEFFEAATYIKSRYPNCNFHICGPCEESYQDQLAELERDRVIEYHGMLKNMIPIYKMAHCIVHPSYHEGMANVLLEASACGRPIIASNIHGCKEALDDGKNGLLCTCKSSESLITEMEKFIKLPYSSKVEMGLYGRRKMKCEFDRSIVVGKYLNALKE